MPIKLSDLPMSFRFSETPKGYFSHLFNAEANQKYVGPVTDPKFYNIDGMTSVVCDHFLRWYSKQKDVVFNMKMELKKY